MTINDVTMLPIFQTYISILPFLPFSANLTIDHCPLSIVHYVRAFLTIYYIDAMAKMRKILRFVPA